MTIVTKEPTKRVGVEKAVAVANIAASKVEEAWKARFIAEGPIEWGAYDAAADAWHDANAAWDALKEAWAAWDAVDAANTESRYTVERFARRIRVWDREDA